MKEKTALHTLIEDLGKLKETENWLSHSAIDNCIKKAELLVELEKKQVMDAYERGVNVAGFAMQGDVFIAKEQYFTDTYEQPK